MTASDELAKKLQRRQNINEGVEQSEAGSVVWNPYTEFKEFTRKQIQEYQKLFNRFDDNNDRFIDLEELKRMMEYLGAPQTHLALKEMIKTVDEDHDNRINLREFLLIFRKATAGELSKDSGLYDLYAAMEEIDVDKEGVGGAKMFFQAKINEQTKHSKFEQEIISEQEERRQAEMEKKQRRAEFKDKLSNIKSQITAAGGSE